MAKSLRSNVKKALRTIKRQKVVKEDMYQRIEREKQEALARVLESAPVPRVSASSSYLFLPLFAGIVV
jgi:hypothetical protein